ncbi:MAG: CpaF family protein [Pseudomonadota bacterium]
MDAPRRRLFDHPAPEAVSGPRPVPPLASPTAAAQARHDAAYEHICHRLMDLVDFVAAPPEARLEARPMGARARLREAVAGIIDTDSALILNAAEREALIAEVVADVGGYGPLEPLLADEDVTEIMVNTHQAVFVERRGRIVRTDVRFRSEEALLRVCRKMAEGVGRRVDSFTPTCDARLPDGSRINIVVPPIAVDGTHLTIRKFRRETLSLDDLVALSSLTPEAADVLRIIGRSPLNVLIAGGTGSGKTTLLNCLSASIDPAERIITCEDTAELQLRQDNVVRLETRPASTEGTAAVAMRDVLRNALRMKPNRVIVGEVRGAEALDLIQAMNIGHAGSMGTIHANDPRGALSRLETCMRENISLQAASSAHIQRLLADCLNILVQTQQLHGGRRVVTHICEVTGMTGDRVALNDLFVFDFRAGCLRRVPGAEPGFLFQAEQVGEGDNLVAALRRAEDAPC